MSLASQHVLAVAAWSFDSDFASSIGDHTLSEVGGTVALSAGKFGTAALFETGQLDLGAALVENSTTFTVRTWANITGDGVILAQAQGANQGFRLTYSSGNISWTVRTNAGAASRALTVPVGLYLIHAWWNASTGAYGMTLNGSQTTQATRTGTITYADDFQLGGDWDGEAITDQFEGFLDDTVVISGAVMTPQDRQDDYDNGLGKRFGAWPSSPGVQSISRLHGVNPIGIW